MKTLTSEITIKAGPAAVWSVLTDFESYPAWNPFIISISGEGKVGKQLSVSVKPFESRPMSFKPIILTFDKNKELKWKGKLFVTGLFDGEHYFKLNTNPDGTTHLVQGEAFSGLLIPLFQTYFQKVLEGFHLMNKALKKRCETSLERHKYQIRMQ